MTQAPVRYGIIGTGMMGCEHITNLVHLPEAEVVAIADPVESSLDWGRHAAGAPVAAYTDHRQLLARDDLDAIVIASPNHTHATVLRDALATDLAVMVEKPMCTTIDDCLDVRRWAADRAALTWVGLEYRFMPTIAALLEQLATGVCGTTRMVSIREHRFPFLVKVGNWNRFTENTGGTLVEKCCHFFDLMRLVLDADPVRVLASGGQDVNHLDERYDTDVAEGEVPDILDNAFVVVDFDSGARAVLDLCMFAEGSRWEQELVATGDAGKVEANVPGFMEVVRGRRPELVLGGRGPDWPVEVLEVGDDERVAVQGGHHGASYLEHLAMVESIRSGARPQVGVDDGVWSVAMGVAAHRSIDEGRVVELSEVLPDDLLAELRRR